MTSVDEPSFTNENVKEILRDLLAAFKLPSNAQKLEEARIAAGNDMATLMRTLFPLVAQIQMDTIHSHGFRGDGDGAVRFILAVKAMEKEDPDITRLFALVKPYFMPYMMAQPSHNHGTADAGNTTQL